MCSSAYWRSLRSSTGSFKRFPLTHLGFRFHCLPMQGRVVLLSLTPLYFAVRGGVTSPGWSYVLPRNDSTISARTFGVRDADRALTSLPSLWIWRLSDLSLNKTSSPSLLTTCYLLRLAARSSVARPSCVLSHDNKSVTPAVRRASIAVELGHTKKSPDHPEASGCFRTLQDVVP